MGNQQSEEVVGHHNYGCDGSEELTLYMLPGKKCPFCARVHIVLEELGIPYNTVEVDPHSAPEWFKEMNPRLKVPTLRNKKTGFVLYESGIIGEFLVDHARCAEDNVDEDAARADADKTFWKIMPNNPEQIAMVRLIKDQIETKFLSSLVPIRQAIKAGNLEKITPQLMGEFECELMYFENVLKESGGPFMMGKEFTLADAHLVPFVNFMKVILGHFHKYEISPTSYPLLLAWLDKCLKKESIQTALLSDEAIIAGYKTS